MFAIIAFLSHGRAKERASGGCLRLGGPTGHLFAGWKTALERKELIKFIRPCWLRPRSHVEEI